MSPLLEEKVKGVLPVGGGRQRRQPSGSNHLGLHACAQRAVNGSRSEGAPVSAEQLTDVACVPGRGAGAPPRGRSLAPPAAGGLAAPPFPSQQLLESGIQGRSRRLSEGCFLWLEE